MRRRFRLAIVVVVVGIGAALPARAAGALFFFFRPTAAGPGDHVWIRTAGSPVHFKPLRRGSPLRIYLVRNAIAANVTKRSDDKLAYVGTLRIDKNGRGSLRFTVPRVRSGAYAAAVWCPICARYSFGSTFFTIPVGPMTVARYRPLMLLNVRSR
jgi:hypothetical protein